jgi:two-component SAPR family response regulator
MIGLKAMLALNIETNGSTENLFNYISEEIYNRFSNKFKKLLLELSFFPFFNYTIINNNLQVKIDKSIKKQLINLPFLEGTSAELISYTFHPLFLEFLKAKAKRDLSQQEIDKYKTLVGTYYEKNGDYNNAISTFIDAKNYKRAIKNISVIGIDIVDSGHIDILENWLSKIPSPITNSSPEMLMLLALAEERKYNYRNADNYILKAEQLLKKLKKDTELRARLFITKATILKHQEEFDEAIKMARRSYSISRNQETKMLALVILSLCYFNKSKFKEAIQTGTRGLRVADRIMSFASHYFLNNLGTMLMHYGDINKAEMYLTRCINEAKKLNRDYQQTVALGNLAKTLLYSGDFLKVEKIINEGLELARKYKFQNLEIQNLNSRGILASIKGEFEKSIADHNEALEIAEHMKNKYLITICFLKIANVYTFLRDSKKTLLYLQRVEKLLRKKESAREYLQYLSIKSKYLMQIEKNKQAKKIITETEKMTSTMNTAEYKIRIELLQYWLYQKSAKPKKAKSFLQKALNITNKYQFDGLFVSELVYDPELLIAALKLRSKKTYIINLVSNLKRSLPSSAETILSQLPREYTEQIHSAFRSEDITHKLAVYLLGEPRLYIKNNEVKSEYWVRKKVKHLLCLLLLNKAGITKDQIQHLFWPESSRTNADRNFWNTIYYLRKTLDEGNFDIDVIIRQNNRLKLHPSLKIFLDTNAFEKAVKNGTYLRQNNEIPKAISAYENALSIYKGDLLASYYEDWIEEKRLYYRSLWQESALNLGKMYYEQHNLLKAFDMYSKILMTDPLSEQAMLGLLKASGHPKLRPEAIKKYKKYVNKLKKELHLQPSQDLQQLYNQLIQ